MPMVEVVHGCLGAHHMQWLITTQSEEQRQAMIARLLEIGTCFAVIGGEPQIITTERGMEATKELAHG